ncbi:hypothetical protein IFO70_05225 [Phormidium tenue FACHB-886]|nr:hypothetical protein [Phormidium tenue FACHB-886]
MTALFQLGNDVLPSQTLVPLLAHYQLVPQLLCDLILDRAIASVDCTPEEIALASQQLYQQWGLTSAAQQQNWRSHAPGAI